MNIFRNHKNGRGKIIESHAKFNYRKGTIKHTDLERLSWQASDFARYVARVLNETGYVISQINEYSSHRLNGYCEIQVCKLSRGPTRILGSSYAGTISIATDKKNRQEINLYSPRNGFERLERDLKKYV